jgi:hypothetical protein
LGGIIDPRHRVPCRHTGFSFNGMDHGLQIVRQNEDLVSLHVHDMRTIKLLHRFGYPVGRRWMRRGGHHTPSPVPRDRHRNGFVTSRNDHVSKALAEQGAAADMLDHRQTGNFQ